MTLVNYNNPTMRRGMMNDTINHNFLNEILGNQKDCNLNNEPRYQVEELDDKFILEMAVPGLSKEDLAIEVENKLLSIKTIERENTEGRSGFSAYEFEKRFKLSRKVNTDSISASSLNGILRVELPKVEQEIAKPARAIDIV